MICVQSANRCLCTATPPQSCTCVTMWHVCKYLHVAASAKKPNIYTRCVRSNQSLFGGLCKKISTKNLSKKITIFWGGRAIWQRSRNLLACGSSHQIFPRDSQRTPSRYMDTRQEQPPIHEDATKPWLQQQRQWNSQGHSPSLPNGKRAHNFHARLRPGRQSPAPIMCTHWPDRTIPKEIKPQP